MRQAARRGESAFLGNLHDGLIRVREHGLRRVQPGVEYDIPDGLTIYGSESQPQKRFGNSKMSGHGLYGYAFRVVVVDI
jgi:hypothetical protein